MNRRQLCLISAVVVIIDRITKLLVQIKILPNDRFPLVAGLFDIGHWENGGAAFDLLGKSVAPWKLDLLIIVSFAAVLAICFALWKAPYAVGIPGIGLSLMLGGAVGNLWDRMGSGRVVDFLDIHVGSIHWPAFNFADSALALGVALLIFPFLRGNSRD